MKSVDEVIAEQLRIPPPRIRDDLAFGSVPEWDSLNHVNLMVALETEYGVAIDEDAMLDLTTVGAIRSFIAARRS
jgi:citrate synthase